MTGADGATLTLILKDGSLSIKAGPTLLTDVPDHVFQTSHTAALSNHSPGPLPNGNFHSSSDSPGALLGVHSLDGKSCSADIPIGKVRGSVPT